MCVHLQLLYIFLILKQVSHNVKAGDVINCTISELQPLRAEPEDIDLDIVYEDEHVLVVNKPAHMVMIQKSLILLLSILLEVLCGCKIPILVDKIKRSPLPRLKFLVRLKFARICV